MPQFYFENLINFSLHPTFFWMNNLVRQNIVIRVFSKARTCLHLDRIYICMLLHADTYWNYIKHACMCMGQTRSLQYGHDNCSSLPSVVFGSDRCERRDPRAAGHTSTQWSHLFSGEVDDGRRLPPPFIAAMRCQPAAGLALVVVVVHSCGGGNTGCRDGIGSKLQRWLK